MRRLVGIVAMAIVSVAAAFALWAPAVLAEDFGLDKLCQDALNDPSVETPAACSSREDRADNRYRIVGANGILARAANIMALIAGIVAVIMIIVASFQFVTAAGDSGKISSAKKTITWAIVGVVVIAAARTIVVFIVSRL